MKLKLHIFSFLVLVAMDLLMSVVMLLGGLSRGIFYYDGWAIYDAVVGLPITGIIKTWCVMATVGVTIGIPFRMYTIYEQTSNV